MAVRWIDRDAESVLRWRPLRHDGSLRRTFSRLDAPSVILIDEDPDPTVDRVPDASIDALVLSALGCGSVFVGAFRDPARLCGRIHALGADALLRDFWMGVRIDGSGSPGEAVAGVAALSAQARWARIADPSCSVPDAVGRLDFVVVDGALGDPRVREAIMRCAMLGTPVFGDVAQVGRVLVMRTRDRRRGSVA